MTDQTERWEWRGGRTIVRVVTAGALAMLASCGPAFPRELFTVTGAGAEYPMMLSRVPAGAGGHRVEASSGTSQLVQRTGRHTYYEERAESDMPASAKLNAQVRRADRWLQIERIVLYARDFSTLGNTSNDRTLSIEGTAFR